MTIYEIDQAKIGFVQAHAMLYELAFSVSDDARYERTADKLFALALKLKDFVEAVIQKNDVDCAEVTNDMICDSNKAKCFFDEHFSLMSG